MNIEKNESYYFQIRDLAIHKRYVLGSGIKLIDYLLENDEDCLAFQLLKRISEHDNTKLNSLEFEMLCQIPHDTKTFTNANAELNELMKKSIELHWKNNRHHPEHFEDVNKMSDIDIMEMCCDWHARSTQYGTDFLDFVKTRQETRFHFPEKMFEKIWKYCCILNER